MNDTLAYRIPSFTACESHTIDTEMSMMDQVRPKWALVNGKLRDVSEFAHVQARVPPVTTSPVWPTQKILKLVCGSQVVRAIHISSERCGIEDRFCIYNHPYGRETRKTSLLRPPTSGATYNAQHTDTYEVNEIERYQHTVEPRKNRQW